MYETLAALTLAHMLADFVLQTEGMVARKARPGVQLRHGLHVLGTGLLMLFPAGPVHDLPAALAALTLLHAGIDAVKLRVERSAAAFAPFAADQAAHLFSLALIAAIWPDLWSQSFWAAVPLPQGPIALPVAITAVAGLIFATRAGGFAVELLLKPYAAHWTRARILGGGLKESGRMIGLLERTLAFVLAMSGHVAAVAFVVAAKSVLRFNATSSDRQVGEYVMIGTLASVTWALATAFGTRLLIDQIAPTP